MYAVCFRGIGSTCLFPGERSRVGLASVSQYVKGCGCDVAATPKIIKFLMTIPRYAKLTEK